MKLPSILTAAFLLSLFVFFVVLTGPFGGCDPTFLPIQISIQGAHIVSAGAYFRFWMFNHYDYPVHVTINGADTLGIPSGASVDYDVIAPQISVPYEKVTYTFLFTTNVTGGFGTMARNPVDYTVLVLNSNFVQIFDLIVPILIVIALVIMATVVIVFLRRRRVPKRALYCIEGEAHGQN